MKILAIDSSTEACSVALLSDQNVTEKFEVIGRGHAEHLLPMISNVLKENSFSLEEIDLFAYGAGPGSFTGLRIGAAMMQGLALARGRKLIAISSLAAMAVRHKGVVLSVIDARMDQVYHGLFSVDETACAEIIGEPGVAAIEEIYLPENRQITVCGTGWDHYEKRFSQRQSKNYEISGIRNEYPHAADIARLAMDEFLQGRETDPAEALPCYVRNDVAKKMNERK